MKYFVQGIENNFPGEHCLRHFLQFGLRKDTDCDESGLSVSYPFMGREETYLYTPEGDAEMFERMKRVWQEFRALPEQGRSCRTALLLAFDVTDPVEHEAAPHMDLTGLIEILLNPGELGKVSDWVGEEERAATAAAQVARIKLFAGLCRTAAENRTARPFVQAAVASGVV